MTSSPEKMPRVILASASPRRKKLLKLLELPFSVKPSDITETYDDNEQPAQIVQRLAVSKAREVASRQRTAVIIGADTLVVHAGHVLGKPETEQQAQRMLKNLSGSTHRVMTGVALVKTDEAAKVIREDIFSCTTSVTFGVPGDLDIKRYVASGQPMDKAGAYGIQDDWSARFIKRIEGDYYNVIGLPVHTLYNQLKIFAPKLVEKK